MAENQDGQEKTEEPTGKRLDDARKKGQVPRSRELNTTVILLAGASTLFLMADTVGHGLSELVANNLQIDRAALFDPSTTYQRLGAALLDMLKLFAPFIMVLALAALCTPAFIGGWSFSWEGAAPKFSRASPLKGIKRLLSWRGLMELAKATAKVVLVGGTGYLIIQSQFRDLLAIGNGDVQSAVSKAFEIFGWAFLTLSAVTIVIAAVDVPFQLWQHRQQLKMTKQEVKEERKQTEGDPDVKGRVRRMQQEAAMSRMMSEVPKADVVVTNPTHFAVALRYNEQNMNAPRVVAKGADLIATQIRSIAREHDVALFSAPPLARALYHSTELNQEIPAELYLAVAQVLAYVYQLRASLGGEVDPPAPPDDLPVPEDFLDGP